MNGIRYSLVIVSGAFPRFRIRSPIDVEKGSPSYYIGFGNSFNSVSSSPRISSKSMAM